jgi:hypothetical protein
MGARSKQQHLYGCIRNKQAHTAWEWNGLCPTHVITVD